MLGHVRDMCLHGRLYSHLLPSLETLAARERARRGDRDGAIPLLRQAVDNLFHERQLWSYIGATAFLVETLLDRGANGDVPDAEAVIERLAVAPADDGLVIRDIWLLRLRALLAKAHGDEAGYCDFRDRYREQRRERLASKDISRGPRQCHDGITGDPGLEIDQFQDTAR